MEADIALAPEDRKSSGCVLGASIGTKVSLAVLPKLARAQSWTRGRNNTLFRFVSLLNICTPAMNNGSVSRAAATRLSRLATSSRLKAFLQPP